MYNQAGGKAIMILVQTPLWSRGNRSARVFPPFDRYRSLFHTGARRSALNLPGQPAGTAGRLMVADYKHENHLAMFLKR
jgi:hypothetical protein